MYFLSWETCLHARSLNSSECPYFFPIFFHPIPNGHGCHYGTLMVHNYKWGRIYCGMRTLPEIGVAGSGPLFASTNFVLLRREFGVVGPQYGLSRKPLTFFRKTSPMRVSSSNVPFSTPIIQYGPVLRNRSFPSICPFRVWNTSTTFPVMKKKLLLPRCQSTNAFRHRCSCSGIAMLRILSSPSSRSCCRHNCSDCFPGRCPRICICKLGTWNSTSLMVLFFDSTSPFSWGKYGVLFLWTAA